MRIWGRPAVPGVVEHRGLTSARPPGRRDQAKTHLYSLPWALNVPPAFPHSFCALSSESAPLGVFMRARGNLRNPLTAVRLGAGHAAYCVGCCWAFMLVLVAVGVMEPLWMAGVAGLIFAEKVLPFGERVVRPAALLLAAGGLLLLVAPHLLSTLTTA